MNNDNSKRSINNLTWQMAVTAILLAICIGSQFLKNLSVYITGPIINLCLVIAVMTVGVWWAAVLAVVTPVTAFLITASPVMQMVPAIIPMIMIGNAILVAASYYFFKPSFLAAGEKIAVKNAVIAVCACLAKALFMGLVISLWLLPAYVPEGTPLREKLPVFQMTFSVTQFVTAAIGFVYFYLIWKPVSKMVDKR